MQHYQSAGTPQASTFKMSTFTSGGNNVISRSDDSCVPLGLRSVCVHGCMVIIITYTRTFYCSIVLLKINHIFFFCFEKCCLGGPLPAWCKSSAGNER